MGEHVNSFHIDVPDFTGVKFDIDPQPPDDGHTYLDELENGLQDELGTRTYRFRDDGRWYLIAVEPGDTPDSLWVKGDRVEKLGKIEVNHSDRRHQDIIERALLDNLTFYLTTHLEYWERGRSREFYPAAPKTTIGGFEAYHGYRIEITYSDGYYLTVDPKIRFISTNSLADYIGSSGIPTEEIENNFQDTYCLLWSENRPTVKVKSVADSVTVDEPTIEQENDGKTSVISYLEEDDKYPADEISEIEPDEPLVKINFPWDDELYDCAPSLLYPSIRELTEPLSDHANRTPKERWQETIAFVADIDYLRIFDHRCSVKDVPRREGVGKFPFPSLKFGDNKTLGTNDSPGNPSRVESPNKYRFAVQEMASEHHAAKNPRGVQDVAVFYPEDAQQIALDTYDIIESLADQSTGIKLSEQPGHVNYDDPEKFEKYLAQFGQSLDGVLIIQNDEAARLTYHDLREALGGLPAQGIELETCQQELPDGESSTTLLNTAIGFAAKLGSRPQLLADSCAADLLIGFSVAGDQTNTGAAVAVRSDGDLVEQSNSTVTATSSTAAPTEIVERMTSSMLSAYTTAEQPPDSITIHKNGQFGDEELVGIRNAIHQGQQEDRIPHDVAWRAVEVSSGSRHRIYADPQSDYLCKTGANAVLSDSEILTTTWGDPYHHRGTPDPLHCTVEAAEGRYDIEEIGRDIHRLSFLNWGAPMAKIKNPLTTYLPQEMHDFFEAGLELDYLPF